MGNKNKMLGWVRRTWQSAIQGLADQGQLQREADVFRLFLCVNYFRGAYDGAKEFETHRIPPYEQQKEMVEDCMTEQVSARMPR